ncbi:MAG TPA: glycosyltransferase family 39 protein [Solirubrobacteraceae bacterium]|jgi:4-amino-4-deoxy-L-arabinose transferase-like glycosyltransferase
MNSTYLLHRPAGGAPAPSDSAAPRADLDEREEERRRDPGWARPALIALLLCTAIAYLWDLSASGYANSFYAAAVQAGTKSWKAFFFGSLDSSSFITVDKPPASLWVMSLSGRIFGFGSWSMLVPQALEGVAAVALLYAAIKRWFGAGAGLLAGALLAITPVTALMFRFNNPDALLVCLLVASVYCLTRALEHAGTRWVIAAGTLIGFAFLAKMMQAFLVLPAFGLVYLVAAPTGLRRRTAQLLAGALAIVVSCGWWVAIVALWPASSRPFIDGSPDNNIFNLIFGYNGLGRIFGSSGPGGGGPGGGGGTGFSGATGLLRLFDNLMGAQASWLLPAALLALVVGLWHSRRAPRTDRTRAAFLLWGGWLLVTAAIFSFGQGVIHTYYTVALVPAVAALIAITGSMLWRLRETPGARFTAALAVLITAAWSYALLDRTPHWEGWLRPLIAASALLAVLGLLAAPALRRLGRRATIAVAVLASVACLAGPVAYSAQTITTAHTGSIPSAGPGRTSMGGFGPGAGVGPGARAGSRALGLPGGRGGPEAGAQTGGVELFGSAGAKRAGGFSTGAGTSPSAAGTLPASGAVGGPGGGGGGGQTTVSGALRKALENDSGHFRWVAAVSGSQTAASLELGAGGEPVMAIGGFSSQGGNLSLAQFKAYVARGEIHYYLASGSAGAGPGGGGPGGGISSGGAPGGNGGASSSGTIANWVEANFKAVKIGSQTVYDLTQPAS